MDKFKIVYDHFVEDYFNPDFWDYYDFQEVLDSSKDSYDDIGCYLNEIQDIRNVIISDFKRILEHRVIGKKNSEKLEEEIRVLVDTYDNGVDYDIDGGHNFLFLTDDYLCFNNYENEIDELLFGELGDESELFNTIVIVDRSYKTFYFIKKSINMANAKVKIDARTYKIGEDKIVSRKVSLKSRQEFQDYSEEEIRKTIDKLNRKRLRKFI